MSRLTQLLSVTALAVITPLAAQANAVLFSDPYDTINMPCHLPSTANLTIEGNFYISGGYRIWSEQQDRVIDNVIYCDQDSVTKQIQLKASLWNGGPNEISSGIIATNQWHHVALVVEQVVASSIVTESLYIDGTRMAIRNINSTVGGADASAMGLGAFKYTDTPIDFYTAPTFQGSIEWFRISTSARYTGASFTVPTDAPAKDTTTLVLYDFSTLALGANVVSDLSGNGYAGQLGKPGVGSFTLATAPSVVADVPEAATLSFLGVAAAGLFLRRRRGE